MVAKFKLGDKVRLSHNTHPHNRVPQHVLRDIKRQRTRTIVAVTYSPQLQCNLYELGALGKGRMCYQFRSFHLVKAENRNRIGRPSKLE